MKKIKIAITGSNGFIGNRLVSALKTDKRYDITSFNRKKTNLLSLETLKSFIEGKDIIIHLAGLNRAENSDLFKINTLGTQVLLDAIRSYAPQIKLIFSSSYQVYFTPNPYSLSKKFAEEIISYYSNAYNLQAIILRLSNIYGPDCKPFYNSAVSTFIYQLKRNLPININGDGNQLRDYIFIDDAIDAVKKAIDYRPKNKLSIFNIGSNQLTSINKIIQLLESIHKKKIKISYDDKIINDFSHTLIDTKITKKELKWHPKISMINGLKLIYDQYEIKN